MPILMMIICLLVASASIQASEAASAMVSADGRVLIEHAGQTYLDISPICFGPKWAWTGRKAEEGGGFSFSGKALDGATITGSTILELQGDNLLIRYRFSSDADTKIHFLASAVDPGSVFHGGVLQADQQRLQVPLGKQGIDGIERMRLQRGEETCDIAISPAAQLSIDGAIRVVVASGDIRAGEEHTTDLRLQRAGGWHILPAQRAGIPDNLEAWFAFSPENTIEGGAAGLSEWLHKPAGKHGFAQIDGKDIIFEDGTRSVFWGTNVEYSDTAPELEIGTHKAAWFAKYGINAVRLHKLSNPGWEGLGSKESATAYDPEKLTRFDHFCAEMRKNGVYYGFSPIWNLKLHPGDKDRLVAYDELVKSGGGPGKADTFGVLWFADDVQQLHIDTIMNLMNHRNPHTGLRYADDPGLLYLEIQNEDDVFFFRTIDRLGKNPTYRAMAAERFCDWLRAKYGDAEGLVKAWGANGITAYAGEAKEKNQRLQNNSIVPILNPWMLDNQLDNESLRPRLLDTLRFYYAMQDRYYKKVEAAVREAGYRGMLVGSNWQAGSGVGHYANLLSDRAIGVIDRHNYFAGGGGTFVGHGSPVRMVSMLDHPGGGLLSTGMQQMADRPFMFSEWLSLSPTPWTAADTAIIAAYGMGLQGWDVSFHFASNHADGFTPGFYEGNRSKVFNNMTPMGIGLYPALARMVLRGDVTESAIFSRRPVTPEQVFTDEIPFTDEVLQNHDVKSFGGDVPPEALAVGRCAVEVLEQPESFQKPNLDAHRQNGTLVSLTEQLRWHMNENNRGWISVDTPGTQAVFGFVPDAKQTLGDCQLHLENDYGLLFVTAADPEASIADSERLLITVQGLSQQTDQQVFAGTLIDRGKPPILLQPVRATVQLKRHSGATVHVLDHDGRRSDRTIPIASDGTIAIDTGRDRALYYEISYR